MEEMRRAENRRASDNEQLRAAESPDGKEN